MHRNTILAVAVAAAAVVLTPAAHARECNGYNTHVLISAEVNDMGNGHTLMTFRNHDILVTDDPSDIFNMLMGECSGTMLSTPDGRSSSAGYCIRKDKDGNSASIDWAWAPGADKGTWHTTGGTGKYADLEASGWWTPVATDGGKQGINRWVGNCSK